jgi:acetyl/propionyl-CoA carboxylase alpha subunit
MRVVESRDELDAAVEGAQREAAGAFGDATVFLERYLVAPRHVEVQVFADSHGNVVSLFERECSIQRRHQKIVEESPSPAVDAALRAEMGEAAVAAARAVGYLGAGTVEFVLAADGSYYFLEMNTRLQVEHPVTELVTGLDLVALQLAVATGEPLPPQALAPTMNGHAIEVRLYAEDAQSGFLPATGRLRRFEIPDSVRVDSGVESGSVVSPYYDAMVAKVVAHGDTRSQAAGRLAAALRGARVHGVTTNRDLLVRILEEPEFLAGATDTAYLDRHDPAVLGAPLLETRDGRRAHAAVAGLASQVVRRVQAKVFAGLPSGWRSNPSQDQVVVIEDARGQVTVRYRLDRSGAVTMSIDDEPVEVEMHSAAYHVIDATIDGIRRRYQVVIPADFATIDIDSPLGSSSYAVVPRFADPADLLAAGSLVAPMPGSVVRVLVEADATVEKGQPLVVLEAMKMEHTIVAPADGTVTHLGVEPGQQVDAGAVLAVVEPAGS